MLVKVCWLVVNISSLLRFGLKRRVEMIGQWSRATVARTGPGPDLVDAEVERL
jgi:hypothetical protein